MGQPMAQLGYPSPHLTQPGQRDAEAIPPVPSPMPNHPTPTSPSSPWPSSSPAARCSRSTRSTSGLWDLFPYYRENQQRWAELDPALAVLQRLLRQGGPLPGQAGQGFILGPCTPNSGNMFENGCYLRRQKRFKIEDKAGKKGSGKSQETSKRGLQESLQEEHRALCRALRGPTRHHSDSSHPGSASEEQQPRSLAPNWSAPSLSSTVPRQSLRPHPPPPSSSIHHLHALPAGGGASPPQCHAPPGTPA
ncbi:hypothetical protein SKAU_G00093290 [Synaphobranchus kaupii]|uniref:Uncharacterized protein n=1 Tax=Synaphobranchus kaupii TaxID=118154 RepID=A0A9Q1J6N5_SYNKA|nr:hypothetical protein SKAU_G00093290 [Synaphobranchus kaupii]